jgi:hypothetical protein
MAYKKCTDNILFLLKYKYPNKVWNKTREDKIIIFKIILSKLGDKCLCLDDKIICKIHNEVYKGLTITDYIIPLMDIDIDPSLRQLHEYDTDYNQCIDEEENNTFIFNL